MYKLTEQDKLKGWIQWEGGQCPVDASLHVEYMMTRNNENIFSSCASKLRWTKNNVPSDITAYRVPQSKSVTKEKAYTLKELQSLQESTGFACVSNFLKHLYEKEKRENSSEYEKYLELKAKFDLNLCYNTGSLQFGD